MHEGLAKGDRCPTVPTPVAVDVLIELLKSTSEGRLGTKIDYRYWTGLMTYQSFTNIDLQCYAKLCSSTCRKFCIMTRRLIDLRELLSFQKERT